jgi:hypothetical protein
VLMAELEATQASQQPLLLRAQRQEVRDGTPCAVHTARCGLLHRGAPRRRRGSSAS